MSLEDAVEEALCYGWIDGKLRSLDKERFALRLTPRRRDSVWSARNIERVMKLEKAGLMTEAGRQKASLGRQSGQWAAALARERPGDIPDDLPARFAARRVRSPDSGGFPTRGGNSSSIGLGRRSVPRPGRSRCKRS